MNSFYQCRLASQIMSRMEKLYGSSNIELLAARTAALIGRYGLNGSGTGTGKHWDQNTAILITYGDTVSQEGKRPLESLKTLLDRHCASCFTHVHILPFFPYSSDDGFSVIHYRNVDPALGKWSDIKAVCENFQLIVDLVLNHLSSESGWFKDFQTGIAPGCFYFITPGESDDLSSVTRPRTTPLLTPVMTPHGKRNVWSTFSADQIDLNYANPDVLFEILDILLFYVSMGAQIIRLDAVAYLWKKPGTSCVNLPETHEIVKLLRDILALTKPDVLLLTETNLPHNENTGYFGTGDEAHLIYQFSLPPLILHALIFETSRYLNQWASALTNPPPGCTFINFTASHDGIGVRPLETIVPHDDILKLAEHTKKQGGKVSCRTNQDGSESPYELNITWFDAVSGDFTTPEDIKLRRFLCSQAVMLSVKGIPAVYFNNLVAAGNDYSLAEKTGRARSLNRSKWQLKQLDDEINNPDSRTGTSVRALQNLLKARAETPAFDPESIQEIMDLGPDIFAVRRISIESDASVTAIHNLTGHSVCIPFNKIPDIRPDSAFDLVTGQAPAVNGKGLSLESYSFAWLISRTDGNNPQ